MRIRRSLFASAIWLLPTLLVIVESFIFLPKTLRSNIFSQYFIVFWGTRALLAPVIIWYTLKIWIDYNRVIRFFLIHLIGFLLFSILFWVITYIFLQDTLYQSLLFGLSHESTKLSVFGLIVDNSLSINILVYVSTVAFCYIWEFFRRNAEANQRAVALERSLLTSRLELLKGQLNTHFLFNTLHTISSLVVRNKGEEANNILLKLGELLRFALKDNKEQLIPLQKEIEILQLYIDIQQTRFNSRLDIEIHYAPELNDVLVPSMLLQPLVENAIRYAVEPFKETGKIEIKIKKINDMISVTIEDNGQTPFETINFNTGIGLQNTKERLEQLFGEKQSFTIGPNQSAGTKVNFLLPLQFSMQ